MSTPPIHVLFLAATEREISPLRESLARESLPFQASLRVTGIGKASSAIEATLALREAGPAFAVQVGCAGAYPSSGLTPGDVVIADLEILGDEGVETEGGFQDLASIGLPIARHGNVPIYGEIPVSRPRFEAWAPLLELAKGRFKARAGRLCTVSTITGTDPRARELEARTGSLAESMEGAAVALAALKLGCPSYEVRGISNRAGKRDRSSWNLELACANAAEIAILLAALECDARRARGEEA